MGSILFCWWMAKTSRAMIPGLFAVALLSTPAAAWEPTERVALVVHASPGTAVDLFLRKIAEIWAKHRIVPQRVSVDNVMGGRGMNALRFVVVENRDNPHVLVIASPSQIVRTVLAKADPKFHPRNFVPGAIMALDAYTLAVKASSPFQSVKDLIEAARQKPKQLRHAGGPFGNIASLMGELLSEETGAQFTYVPFKGSAEGGPALLGGHVEFILAPPMEVIGHAEVGKMRLLAVTAPLPAFPTVPTFASLGYQFSLWPYRGVALPPGVPKEVAVYYRQALRKAVTTPEWKEYVRQNSLVEQWIEGAAMKDVLERETEQYERLLLKLKLLK